MSTHAYPVALALEDYVPVLLTGAGLALLAPYAGRRFGTAPYVAAGAVLATAGGLLKATWKLIVALDGPDVHWMNAALFPLLSTAFLVLLYGLCRPAPGRPRAVLAGALLAALALGHGASAATGDTWPDLIVMIVAVSVLAVRLAVLARADGDGPAAALFAVWLAGQYLLGPMAARAEQSVALQWVEQGCNTVAQGAFAIAAWRLSRPSRPPSPRSAEEVVAT